MVQEIFRLHNEHPIIDKAAHYPSLLYFGLERKSSDKIMYHVLELEEDVNMGNGSGITPLLLAFNRVSRRIPHRLILSGADLDTKNRYGLTCLHEVIIKGDLESVCMLLFYGADVNIRDTEGKNAFEQAMSCNEYEIAEHLIDYVADFNEKSEEGFTTLHLGLRDFPEMVPEIIKKGGDINIPWFETHCIHLCIWWHYCSKVFEVMWPLIDFEVYSKLHDIGAFFNTFVGISKFPREEFLKCMYLVLDSEHAPEFFDFSTAYTSVRHNLLSVLERDLSLDETIEVSWVLLSYGVEIYFNDVCFLYELYGFEECVQMILMSGCCIYPSDHPYINPLLSKICYNNFDIYAIDMMETRFCLDQHMEFYSKYYKLNFDHTTAISDPEFSATNCVKSLVQLSRDVVRDVIYKAQSKKYTFKVYQAFSQLPIPFEIRDILFLKRAIY